MSSLIVEVCKVDKVEKHPNADRMAVAVIKGWRTCIGVGQFAVGEKCIYIPPDTILPVPLAEKLNVAKYCSPVKNKEGIVQGYRVQVSRLRGEPSYGFITSLDILSVKRGPSQIGLIDWKIGDNVVADLGLTKWEPPLDCTDGDAEKPHPAFHHYYNLENINNFPTLFKDGEEVIFTEKIHGKNCRVGLIRDTKDDGTPIWRFMAGSHDVRRKELTTQRKRRVIRNSDGTPCMEKDKEVEWFYEITKKSQFYEALDKPGIRELLLDVCNGQNNVVVFGELFGSGVQDMAYGFENGNWDLRVFDITVNGKYLSVNEKQSICNRHMVSQVPELYRGPFSHEKVQEYIGGDTTVCNPVIAGLFKEREGLVITSVKERTEVTEAKFFDRAALKAINFKYLERKEGTEYH
jgi:RNA ligase (TIGR02306 family)